MPISVHTALTCPECQSAWAVTHSLLGEHVRIMQETIVQVFLCKPHAARNKACLCLCWKEFRASLTLKSVDAAQRVWHVVCRVSVWVAWCGMLSSWCCLSVAVWWIVVLALSVVSVLSSISSLLCGEKKRCYVYDGSKKKTKKSDICNRT